MSLARRIESSLVAHSTTVLVLMAAVPFIPGAAQFLHRGVPEVLFTGDGATLELRALHASHGTQLLGPYSRFQWSHPGPAFFYLALPIYEAFRHHGPALNLFVFLANFACALMLVLSARRLRGDLFAFAVALMLAIYECVGAHFQLSGEWNPVVPVLPVGLLSFLCVALGLGRLSVLPGVVLLASAIVQTHIGYLPIVAVILTLALALNTPPLARYRMFATPSKRQVRVLMGVTAFVLVLLWLPPVVQNATKKPGNLDLLYRFFTAPHRPEHSWRAVIETVADQLAVVPLAAAEVLGISLAPRAALTMGLWCGQWIALEAALLSGFRRRDSFLIALSTVAIAEMIAAIVAVHNIRGEIHPYLVEWISMISVISTAAMFAWVLPSSSTALRERAVVARSVALCALLILGLSVRIQTRRVDVFRSHDEMAERLAHDIHRYLVEAQVDHPLIRIATGDRWPTAVAVVLYLYKMGFPLFVERYWLFMMGDQFAAGSTDHPWLSVGDREFCELSRERPDVRLIATVGESCALLGDPHYMREHRLAEKVSVLSATGVDRDPKLAVDGVVPPDGWQWDSPLSVILTSKESAIEVALPPTDVGGVFLSADGSDVYALHCIRPDGSSFKLGSILAGVPIGMGTGFLASNELSSCRSIRVNPERGDGYYSVGEIGFLRK